MRVSQGLSQGELSDKLRAAGLNWSQGTLSRVEAGTRPVRFTEAFTVANVLGIDAIALAPAGGGLQYVYHQDLDAIVAELQRLQANQRQFDRAIGASETMRFAIELSEGRQGPYVVHSSVAAITHWLAHHMRTTPVSALELLGIPRAVTTDQLARAAKDFQSIKKSGLDPEWEGPDYAPHLGEWISNFIDRISLDVVRPEGKGRDWMFTLAKVEERLHDAAIASLWSRYFPFVTESANARDTRDMRLESPAVEGIDVTEIEMQSTMPMQPPSAIQP
nr:helix-turn-helix transcriptional regulator [Rhodococcus sp. BL-253-APC-6A1W]